MQKLGLSEKWISWKMMCVCSVAYSVVINGDQSGRIFPTRGLRQVKPLSSYLFLLCVEGLSCLLHQAELRGDIRGVAVTKMAPKVSHLLFADDSIFFLWANVMERQTILDLLRQYEKVSGQVMNVGKSAVLFSSITSAGVQSDAKTCLGINKDVTKVLNLGLPLLIGRSKKRVFQRIKDKGVVHELNMIIARFWWGGSEDQRSIHWKSWDSLCVLKLVLKAKYQGTLLNADIGLILLTHGEA
ncbi:uncharacterized protein LOC111274575 [Durio zibethinus]|uniref:Uncharacterized protein LOC111274575 n=1 Tax=Durio zibethinus TaxID=66656 RepID=A0A6P5WGV8_DURZI|nr:uncharacterized protein LOC111274575 [Durio zibethinus]